jgi:CYTH domain-containing protein
VKLTNMYISESEYAVLSTLDGAALYKTRWRWAGAAGPMVVDEFGGHLAGLIMAEVELMPEDPRMADPPGAVADVTDDDRFSGGTLAETGPAQIQALLNGIGVTGASSSGPGT